MKKLIITMVLVCVCGIGLTGCNTVAKNFGGTVKVDLPVNQKLVEATWKDDSLWYLTKPMKDGDTAETYTFQENSNTGILEGKVFFNESVK